MLKAYYENMLLGATNDFIKKNNKYFFPKDKVNFSVLKKNESHKKNSRRGTVIFYNLETQRIHEEDIAKVYLEAESGKSNIGDYMTFNDKIKLIKT